MKIFTLKYFYLLLALLTPIVKPLFSQVPDFSKVLELHEGDSLNITYLINNGVKISDRKVICWFPKDSLSEKQMNEIAHMLNTGIRGAEKFINAPLSWQVHQPNEPYTFYFRFDRFISHASCAGFVSIPFWRIKAGKAPWLHEVMHEMLYSKTESLFAETATEEEHYEKMPLWLVEGLPEYISQKVSLIENLPWFNVFSKSYQPNIDSLFITEKATEKGEYVLSFIGANRMLPELNSEDRFYAFAFYNGSYSFVKYLAENYSIKILLTAISLFGHEQETIEKLTGKSMETLKKEWLDKLTIIK